VSTCSRCESLPEPLPEGSTLYIAPPLPHTRGVVSALLNELEIDFSHPDPEIVAVPLAADQLPALAAGLARTMSVVELQDTRSLVLPTGREAALSDLMRMQPLSHFLSAYQGQWLAEVLREERLVTFYQPIVRSDAPEEIFAYECLLRARAPQGELIYPDRLFGAARSAQMLFHLDRAARVSAIRGVVQHQIQACLFINFNPTSVYNPTFCLNSTLQAVRDCDISPEQIVFEVVESDRVQDPKHLLRIVEFYRNAGFRVALDDLGAGYSSLSLLTQLRPDFVKLDMSLTRGVDEDPYKAEIAGKLLELAHGLEVSTIAEGVETEGEWRWCRDHGADYVQGYLFARPGCPPPQPRTQPVLEGAR